MFTYFKIKAHVSILNQIGNILQHTLNLYSKGQNSQVGCIQEALCIIIVGINFQMRGEGNNFTEPESLSSERRRWAWMSDLYLLMRTML